MRVSDIAFITKILQMRCQKTCNGNIFLDKNVFPRKKGQKRTKRPNTFFKTRQLDLRPKKVQQAN